MTNIIQKNIIEQKLMANFFNNCTNTLYSTGMLSDTQTVSILEAGCGEGNFTLFLKNIFKKAKRFDGFDVSKKCIEEASLKCPNVNFTTGSIYEIQAADHTYDFVAASEVLEHLEGPEKALKELLRVSKKYVLITVPNEPLWRILNMARGKYLKRFGNTPGHIQHWNKRKFTAFANSLDNATVIRADKSIPWLIILIKKG